MGSSPPLRSHAPFETVSAPGSGRPSLPSSRECTPQTRSPASRPDARVTLGHARRFVRRDRSGRTTYPTVAGREWYVCERGLRGGASMLWICHRARDPTGAPSPDRARVVSTSLGLATRIVRARARHHLTHSVSHVGCVHSSRSRLA